LNEGEAEMKGTIRIELRTLKDLPESGSKMPEMGHDAYWLKKALAELAWDEGTRLLDKYEVVALETSGP
jgi:hypothetical protein